MYMYTLPPLILLLPSLSLLLLLLMNLVVLLLTSIVIRGRLEWVWPSVFPSSLITSHVISVWVCSCSLSLMDYLIITNKWGRPWRKLHCQQSLYTERYMLPYMVNDWLLLLLGFIWWADVSFWRLFERFRWFQIKWYHTSVYNSVNGITG